MRLFRLPRVSDPTVTVDVSFEDLGDTVPGLSPQGFFPAYTSLWKINGRSYYVQVALSTCPSVEMPQKRTAEDYAFLASKDLDPTTLLDQIND